MELGSILFGYAFHLFVAIKSYFIKSLSGCQLLKSILLLRNFFFVLMVLITIAIAELVQNASLLLSLVGSVGCTMSWNL